MPSALPKINDPSYLGSTLKLDQARPVLSVNRAAVLANVAACRRALGETEFSAVVKSNAYGLGLENIVPLLAETGCKRFWVNDLIEAEQLRLLDKTCTVYALHGLTGFAAQEFEVRAVIPVIGCLDELEELVAAGKERGQPYAAALLIEVGLGRLGLDPDALRGVMEREGDWAVKVDCYLAHLSHFAHPEDPTNQQQADALAAAVQGLPPAPTSLTTSTTSFNTPSGSFDISRVGTAIYGLQAGIPPQAELQPALRLTAPIIRVADMEAGTAVGYAPQTLLARESRIATLPLGYAHGLPKHLPSCWPVRLGEMEAPLLGGLAMSLAMADVTDLAPGLAEKGELVTIFDESRDLDQMAKAAGMLQNDLLTAIAPHCDVRVV